MRSTALIVSTIVLAAAVGCGGRESGTNSDASGSSNSGAVGQDATTDANSAAGMDDEVVSNQERIETVGDGKDAAEVNDTSGSGSSSMSCPMRYGFFYPFCPNDGGPLPICDLSSEGCACYGSEGYSLCVDGKWLGCPGEILTGVCRNWDFSPVPAEGTPCCIYDYNSATGEPGCCIRGRHVDCVGNHVAYGGTCGDAGSMGVQEDAAPESSRD